MKYAILSDIHSNYEALSAVLEKCDEIGVDKYICLGDVIGYNADPQLCTETMMQLKLVGLVKGNHDQYVSTDDPSVFEGVTEQAVKVINWTKENMKKDAIEVLRSTPMKQVIKGSGITIVHATLDLPEKWGYIEDEYQAELNFRHQFTPLCFIGHSHVPLMFGLKPVILSSGRKRVEKIEKWKNTHNDHLAPGETEIAIEKGWKYLINPGSVGQPRNRDPRASFAVYDSEDKIVKRICLCYNIRTTQEKIRHRGLGEKNAKRLEHGV